jgi:hypothetical protein
MAECAWSHQARLLLPESLVSMGVMTYPYIFMFKKKSGRTADQTNLLDSAYCLLPSFAAYLLKKTVRGFYSSI